MLHGLKVLPGQPGAARRGAPSPSSFHEPADVPRAADRTVLNRYLETFLQRRRPAQHLRAVLPVGAGRRPGAARTGAAPDLRRGGGRSCRHARHSSCGTCRRQAASRPWSPATCWRGDLGLDSLAQVDLTVWLEREFGCAVEQADALRTAGDVILAACGPGGRRGRRSWRPSPPAGSAPTAPSGLPSRRARPHRRLFLAQARRTPGRVIVADQTSGAKTYRDLVTAVLVLRPVVAALPGEAVGIMLPVPRWARWCCTCPRCLPERRRSW